VIPVQLLGGFAGLPNSAATRVPVPFVPSWMSADYSHDANYRAILPQLECWYYGRQYQFCLKTMLVRRYNIAGKAAISEQFPRLTGQFRPPQTR